jgi:hypothetical protein
MRRLMLLSVALVLFVPAAASSARSRLPSVLTQSRPLFEVRPAQIGYTGDGTGVIGGVDGRSARYPGHLEWTVYNQRRGVAHGVVWIDDCDPDCAEGTFTPHPVTVRVGAPRGGRFRRLTLTYDYRGRHVVDRRTVYHDPPSEGYRGSWYYQIADDHR